MDVSKLENIIDDAWENRDTISTDTKGEVRKSVEEAAASIIKIYEIQNKNY